MSRHSHVMVVLVAILLSASWLWPSGPAIEACMPSEILQSHSLFIEELVTQVSQVHLYDTIRDLQDDDALPGWDAAQSRYTYASGSAVERDYIHTRMEQAGLTVREQIFPLGGTTQVNIEGELSGADPGEETVYILCAHYDSTSNNPSHAAPGADDNASGVAGMLEAARTLGQYRFQHTLRFVAFAGEEQRLDGSAWYARAARRAGTKIGGVINLDMIAWNGAAQDIVEIYAHPYNGSEALGEAFSNALFTYHIGLTPRYDTIRTPGYSDHYSFWVQGYPALLITDDNSVRNPYYHTTGDTLDKLDLAYARRIVQVVMATLAEQAEIISPTQ